MKSASSNCTLLEADPGDYNILEGGGASLKYYTSIYLPNNCSHLPVMAISSIGSYNYRVHFLSRNVQLYFLEGNFGAISKSQLFRELLDKLVAPENC